MRYYTMFMFMLALNTLVYGLNMCTDCEYLVQFIRYEVNLGNHTIQDIAQLLRDICSNIIGPGGIECVDIANEIENISRMIANGVNNTDICKDLHFCNNTL
jgi:hypothetical protein